MNFKKWYLRFFLFGTGALTSCMNTFTTPLLPLQENTLSSRSDQASSNQLLMDLIWKAVNSEEAAAREKILPHLEITKIPPLIEATSNYSRGGLSSENPNTGERQPRMIELGLDAISYNVQIKKENKEKWHYLQFRINTSTTCITIENVMARFGKNFEKLPARIVAPAPSSSEFKNSGALEMKHDIAAMLYRKLFRNHGEIVFRFEYQECAESIVFHTENEL